MTEIFGYLAMIMLVISFIPKQLKLIRVLNLAGCIFFVIYGILLGWKWPIIISNGLVAVIQIWHLFANISPKSNSPSASL
ncbi:MAG: uroporphyrinogen decarboxylase [Niabella sp.]